MRKSILFIMFMMFCFAQLNAQPGTRRIDRLKVFIDCSSTRCDMNFIRTEINLVDFMLDRIAADVHVLVTQQSTGGGGNNYQLIFFGQQQFKNLKDTIHFNTDQNATDFERRDQLIKYIQLGLAPFVAKTTAATDAIIKFKKEEKPGDKKDSIVQKKDPWNFWVFNLRANGNFSADENYENSSLSLNVSGSRVTDKLKIGFSGWGNRNTTVYDIEDTAGIIEKISVKNDDYTASHFMIASLGKHTSFGYQFGFSRNTFSNNKRRLNVEAGLEIAIFPYTEVNTKYWTISYLADIRHNVYFDTTLYDKTEEYLMGHALETKIKFNQKWGTLSFGADYHNYLHDWSLFRLGLNSEINIRITGGLSLNMYTYAELTRNQVFLPKAGATPQEVLTRRRQLASGYNFYTYFGLNYRFGSKLNNFVNPRFD